jgi:hypothetical protein
MVLPVTQGPDPVLYTLSLAGICIAFMKLGMNDWTMPTPIPDATSKKFYAPLQFTAFWAMQFFSLLLHGAILAGLIVMYQGTLRNFKDNVILVLQSIALGLNLCDYFFKSYFGMYALNEGSIKDGLFLFNNKKFEAAWLGRNFKWAMFFIQIFGLAAFFTTSFAYMWIGEMTDMSSNSRSMLTASGLCLILLFGFGLATFYQQRGVFLSTAGALLKVSGVKLNITPIPNTTGKPLHGDIHVSGIAEALQHDNPDTPLFMAAAAKAAQGVKPGITAENWMVIKSEEGPYLVSPQVFDAHQDLMLAAHGRLLDASAEHSGQSGSLRKLEYVSKALHSGMRTVQWHKIGYHTETLDAYTLFVDNVAGFGKGLGIYFNSHPWLPLVSTFYMFAFYLIALQNTESALSAVTIAHVPGLIMCFFGMSQQWWEVFRWNFLIAWSLINVEVYPIVMESSRYIRDPDSWNITNLPVQSQPSYTTVDNSTTVLGYNAFSVTLTGTVLFGIIVIFFVQLVQNGCKCKRSAVPTDKTKVNPADASAMLDKGRSEMRQTSSTLTSVSKRSIKYLT